MSKMRPTARECRHMTDAELQAAYDRLARLDCPTDADADALERVVDERELRREMARG